nr:MAG TPA: hypothetical protein [Caudoviricetes sp.]
MGFLFLRIFKGLSKPIFQSCFNPLPSRPFIV